MSTPKRYTITSALPYTNGPIHIGHLAGVYVPADIYSRYLRITGNDVAFICGSDEHGAAIPMRAKKEGVSINQFLTLAAAEKISALRTVSYLQAEAEKGSRQDFDAWLLSVPDAEPDDRDRL